jgi:hypothetical protein
MSANYDNNNVWYKHVGQSIWMYAGNMCQIFIYAISSLADEYLKYRLLADITLCSSKTTIVEEVTTLHRHPEVRHSARYHTWATSARLELRRR